MKKLFTFILAVSLCWTANNAFAQSCCKKPTGTGMKALALNKSFRAAHLPPEPISYTPASGSTIQFTVTGGNDGSAFFIPGKAPSDNVLFVFHEWWGLNDYIRKEAEHLQELLGGNVDVYAIDVYDGKTALTAEEAGKLMTSVEPQRVDGIINGALKKIGKKKVATIGWCMGGSWSFTASALAGSQGLGCVMYYGFPEKNANRIKPLRSDVLYIRATQDGFIKKADVDEFGAKVKASGHDFILQNFDAVHAFANPSNPKYDVKSAGEAQAMAIRFLKEKLSIK